MAGRGRARRVAALAVSGAVVVAAGAPSPAAAAARHARWRIDTIALDAVLYDAASAGTDLWAVGAAGGGAEAVALRREGDRWVSVAVPGAAGSRIDGVDGIHRADVWAVGSTGYDTGRPGSLILHWDGRRWSAIPTGDDTAPVTRLVRVDAVGPHDAWAVGYEQGPELRRGVVKHWDGRRWSRVALPDLGDFTLSAVTAVSRREVWVAGRDYSANQPLVLRWDGRRWARAGLPPVGDVEYVNVEAVVHSGHEVSALGYTQHDGSEDRRPLAIHLRRGAWTLAPTPARPGQLIDATRWRGETWAVGYGERPALYRWGGRRWVSVPAPGLRYAAFFSVVAVPGRGGGLLAVGAAPGPDEASSTPLVAWYR